MEKIDHLLHAKWIVTCSNNKNILEDHCLAIKEGKITAILPSKQAKETYQAANEQFFSSHALTPGFINSHTHIAMNIFRGLSDDLELMDWLTNHIWPAETKWVSDELVYDASLLAMAEMIRSGTTCFNDMYFFPESTARAAKLSGMRAFLGMTIINVPTAYASTTDEYFAKGMDFYQMYKKDDLITPTFAPSGVYTVLEKDLKKIKSLADEYDLLVNIHCQEAASDVLSAIKFNNKRPLRCLNDVGLVSPRLLTIHMTQLDEGDFEILQKGKPQIVHCPESNMKLASGICPVEKLTQLGVNVALGTDGAASNNDLDMIGEMRTAAFLAKLSTNNPKSLPAQNALHLATLNGARALRSDHLIGSLEVGKSADLIAIHLDAIETQPLYHPISQIVYAASRNQVTDTWVAGKQLLKNRKLTTLDETDILEKAKAWRKKINPS